jgi:hypothetical protein
MGNRAVITTAPYKPGNTGIYLHWNGGRASIEGFLQAAKKLGYRSPGSNPQYAIGSLAGLIWTYLGTDGYSLGIGRCDQLDVDNSDNGTYLIGGDWEIVGRKYYEGGEEINPTKTDAIAKCVKVKSKAAHDAQIEESQL